MSSVLNLVVTLIYVASANVFAQNVAEPMSFGLSMVLGIGLFSFFQLSDQIEKKP